MDGLKKFLAGLCAALFVLTLLNLGFVWSVYKTLGNPQPLKAALQDSGIYRTGVQDALRQVQKEQGTQPGGEMNIPLHQPEIQAIIRQAFPPAYLQAQSEGVLDGTYRWLQGDSPQLAFTIDLAGPKQRLADGVGAYARQRLAALPACTAPPAPGTQVDPFQAACVPAGFNIDEASAKAADHIRNGEFLKDTSLSADTIQNGQGQSLSEQLKAAPQAYQAVQWAIYATGALALLLAAGVIFCSPHWRTGLRRTGIIAICIGAISVALAWLGSWGLHRAVQAFTQTEQATALHATVLRAADSLGSNLRVWWMGYGIGLLVLGLIAVVILRYTRSTAAEQGDVLVQGGLEPATEGTAPPLPPTPAAGSKKPKSSSKR